MKDTSKDPGRTVPWQRTLVSIALITVLGLLAYSNTFNSPFQWDDKPEIAGNHVIKHLKDFLSDVKGYRYNPRRFVGYLTFALNYKFGGLDVTGYHIVNLIVHVVNAVLVYFLVMLTFQTPYFSMMGNRQWAMGNGQWAMGGDTEIDSRKSEVHSRSLSSASADPPVAGDSRFLIALFSALLFVAHPVQTQAVTYVIQRFASLATMFYLLSVVLYIKARERQVEVKVKDKVKKEQVKDQNNKISASFGRLSTSTLTSAFYFLSLLFALCAMKTKEIAFTLPIAIILYEFLFFNTPLRKRLVIIIPVLLLLLIIPASLMGTGKPIGEILSDLGDTTRIQTNIPRWDYAMTQMRVIVTYIRLIFFPVNQNLDYDYPIYRSLFDPAVAASFVLLAAILVAAVYLFFRSRRGARGHGPWATPLSPPLSGGEEKGGEGGFADVHVSRLTSHVSRLIAFGIFWFFITLSVESSIIPIADVIFEHRVYLPSVGAFIAITTGILTTAARVRAEKAALLLLVFITLMLSAATYARNAVWADELVFWQDVVKKSPQKMRPHINLGSVYYRRGRADDALREAQTALKINPRYDAAHSNLGSLYVRLGRMSEALDEYRTALKLNPRNAVTHRNLGFLYLQQGNIKNALAEYQTALKLVPDYAEAHNSLGLLYINQGRRDEALREFEAAVKIAPEYWEAQDNLKTYGAYATERQEGKGVQESRVGRSAGPDSAKVHFNLGNFYSAQGRTDEALREYRTFVRLKPDSAEGHNNLGNVYYDQGLIDQALREYKAALKLSPDYAEAHFNLGNIYQVRGANDLALREYLAALETKPDSAEIHFNLGVLYLNEGRMDEAQREFEAALRYKPDYVEARNKLEVILRNRGNH